MKQLCHTAVLLTMLSSGLMGCSPARIDGKAVTELADPGSQPPIALITACALPVSIPPGPLTAGPAERLWLIDRIALVECGARKEAETEFYRLRDEKLAGK